MSAWHSKESELRAQVELLRRELDRARVSSRSAEERIRALVRERDALAQSSGVTSRRVAVETVGPEAAQVRRGEWQEPEAVCQFVGGVAHDFNNVLAVITGGFELLARTDQPERRARLIKRIEEAAWRGCDLTRRLQAFARQSGGETAQSEDQPVEGSTASVQLPRAAALPEAPEHLSVLIVEDDDEMAAVVADMLDRLGHHCLRVSTLASAVAVLSGGEAVDLIFADVLLSGGGSGLDLAREIERRKLRLPIVLTSGFGCGMRGRLAAARLPFLPKPYTLTALQQVLQQAARPLGPEATAPS